MQNKITRAAQKVFELTGLDRLPPGIVPLDELIRFYPIYSDELHELTYRRAMEFLSARAGRPISVQNQAQSDKPLAGFLYTQSLYSCILVKASDPVARKRFSAAHELGHYVLHFLPFLDEADESSEIPVMAEGLVYEDEKQAESDLPSGQVTLVHNASQLPAGSQQMEREANQFAAELLMPAPACETLVEQYSRRYSNKRPVLASRLAGEFLVSQEAMLWRLTYLKLGY